MLYLNEEIPCKFLHGHPIVPSAEIIYIEFHQLKRNWLLLAFSKPPIQSDLGFLVPITKVLDFYSQKYEYLFIIGDLKFKD